MNKCSSNKFLLLLVALITISFCTACSDSEIEFMQALSDAASMTETKETGEIVFSFNKPYSPAVLNNITYRYTAESNSEKMQNKINGQIIVDEKSFPLNILINKNKLYLSTAGIADFYQVIEPQNTDGFNQLKSLLGESQWVQFDLIDDDTWRISEEIFGAGNSIHKKLISLSNKLTAAYNDYNANILKIDDKTYTLQLTSDDFADILNSLIRYSTQNSDKVYNTLTEWINETSLISAEDKTAALSNSTDLFNKLITYNADALTEKIIDDLRIAPLDFNLEYSITPRITAFDYDIKFNVSTDKSTAFSLEKKCTVQRADDININYPKDKITVFKDWQKSAGNKFTPAGVTATIYLDADVMYYHHYYALPVLDCGGSATPGVLIRNNTTYLALRPVAEACGEEIAWDNNGKRAVIIRNGQKIYINAYTDTESGRSYLKIRDFEKLGYLVDYSSTAITGREFLLHFWHG